MLGWGERVLQRGWTRMFESQRADCSRLKSDPQRYQVLILRTCGCYMIWEKSLCRCDNLRISSCGNYHGLSRWALNAGRGLAHTEEKIMHAKMQKRKTWRCWPWRAGWCSHSQGMLAASGNGFSTRAFGGSTALLTLWLWSRMLILDFRPPELWEIKFLLFSVTMVVVICYSSPRVFVPEVGVL